MARPGVVNAFILALEAGFRKSDLYIRQKQNFMQGKYQKEIPIPQLPQKFEVDFFSTSNTPLNLLA
jgi:hypothetical protein